MSYVIFRAYFLAIKILLRGAETSGIGMASGNTLIHRNILLKTLPQPSNPKFFRVLEINQR